MDLEELKKKIEYYEEVKSNAEYEAWQAGLTLKELKEQLKKGQHDGNR